MGKFPWSTHCNCKGFGTNLLSAHVVFPIAAAEKTFLAFSRPWGCSAPLLKARHRYC